MIDLSQLNVEEMIREYEEEEVVKLMNIIIENGKKDIGITENVSDIKERTRKSKKETREYGTEEKRI